MNSQDASTDELPHVLTVQDVARLLRVSPKQVRSLPLRRIAELGPRTIRYRRKDVLAFMERRRVGAGKERAR